MGKTAGQTGKPVGMVGMAKCFLRMGRDRRRIWGCRGMALVMGKNWQDWEGMGVGETCIKSFV